MQELSQDTLAIILMTFGGLFFLGLTADLLGRHSPLPRVTLLILAGFMIGPSGLDWLPSFTQQWFPVLTDIALAMIGFLLGQSFTRKNLRTLGKPIIGISLGVTLSTLIVMFFGLWLLGVSVELAIILSGIALATAPAPVVDVIAETQAKGPFANTLLGIVAMDDAWALIVFSLLLVVANVVMGNGDSWLLFMHGLYEVFGSVALGLFLGIPMAYLTSHLYPGKASQAEVLGMVLLGAGLAEWFGLSYILTAMVMGASVANLASHHKHRPFHELQTFQWPLMILFFLMAGAALNLDDVGLIGWIGVAYIVLRIFSRFLGAYLASQFLGADAQSLRWMGLAMLPHAGVAIGMALMAVEVFPHLKEALLAIILAATVVFEIIGPIVTRKILQASNA